MRLTDFEPLRPAEARLADWLRQGRRDPCPAGEGVPPEDPPEGVVLRATLLRALMRGKLEDCPLPATGLRVRGAFVLGDDTRGGRTPGLDLEGARAEHDLALIACRLPDPLVLRDARLGNLVLAESHLMQGLDGERLETRGSVSLAGAVTRGRVLFHETRLGGDLDCGGARMACEDFALVADGMVARGGLSLRGAEIEGTVRLVGARLGSDLSCTRARITATVGGKALACDSARIEGMFYLRDGAKIAGEIDLTGAQIGAINDDEASWPESLILDRCRYGAFLGRAPVDGAARLRWLALQRPQDYGLDFWPQPHEHCAQVLRESGSVTEARKILIAKERLQRAARRDRLRRAHLYEDAAVLALRDGLLAATVRYGRQPLLAFVWLLALWALGTAIFGQAARLGEVKPNLPQVLRAPEWVDCDADGARRLPGQASQLDCFRAQPEARAYPTFNAVIYAADTLFPVVSLEMQAYWLPDDSRPFGRLARWYLWLHVALGWALTLLAVAGFSGLIKTDNTR